MRRFAIFGFLLGLACGCSPAQTNPAGPTPPKTTFDYNAPAESQVPVLHDAWAAEHDPAKRRDLAGQLVEAVIHEYDKAQPDIVDEVARDGAPKNEIKAFGSAQNVKLDTLTVLAGVHSNPDDYPRSPIFRRMTANRLEVWIPKEGWLFDGKGKLLADVKVPRREVPRRDGAGREWFGAFLSDGTWITTDLWANDEQLNCFSSTGKWQWELDGKKMLSDLPKPKVSPDAYDVEITPSIGWARADKTGRRWLVSIGTNWNRAFAFVGIKGTVRDVPGGKSLWNEVYPRSMGVRGMYTELYIDSDDGKVGLHRGEAGHGVGVGWPNYDLSNKWSVIIPEGDEQFGFWPGSHRIYIEGSESGPEPWHLPRRVWFFDADGRYEGEVTGSRLGDAANGHDLLVQDADNQVLQVESGKTGLAIRNVRRFAWSDGTIAVPLAIYDDIHLGFFLRGPGMQGFADDARRARAGAEVVLARW